MRISSPKNLKNKDLIVFDLDGTLVASKSPMETEMSALFCKLLEKKKVAVISGGTYKIFVEQFLKNIKDKKLLKNLFAFPTTGTAFYKYSNSWKKIYSLDLTKKDKEKIKKAFNDAFEEVGYKQPKKLYGKTLEDRGTQMSYSFLGQDVVKMLGEKKGVALKTTWKNQNTPFKIKIAKMVQGKLPQLEVHAAGYTTIDITRKGVDKAYGLKQMQKYLKIPIKRMLFVGDAIFPGGNDYAALRTGVDYAAVEGPSETKKLIKQILK